MKRKFAVLCLCLLLILPGCSNMADDTEAEETVEQVAHDPPEEAVEREEPVEPEEAVAPEEPAAGEPVVDGAFPFTPQELVDILNEAASLDDSGKAIALNDYAESGEAIWPENGSTSLILTLDQNDAGMLKHVYFLWMNEPNLNVQYTSGLFIGTMIAALLPNHWEGVAADCDSIFNDGFGSVEYTFDSVQMDFELLQDYGYMDIRVAE